MKKSHKKVSTKTVSKFILKDWSNLSVVIVPQVTRELTVMGDILMGAYNFNIEPLKISTKNIKVLLMTPKSYPKSITAVFKKKLLAECLKKIPLKPLSTGIPVSTKEGLGCQKCTHTTNGKGILYVPPGSSYKGIKGPIQVII